MAASMLLQVEDAHVVSTRVLNWSEARKRLLAPDSAIGGPLNALSECKVTSWERLCAWPDCLNLHNVQKDLSEGVSRS